MTHTTKLLCAKPCITICVETAFLVEVKLPTYHNFSRYSSEGKSNQPTPPPLPQSGYSNVMSVQCSTFLCVDSSHDYYFSLPTPILQENSLPNLLLQI